MKKFFLIIFASFFLSGCAVLVGAGYDVKNALDQTGRELFSLPSRTSSAYLQGKADARYQREIVNQQREYNAGYRAGGGNSGAYWWNNGWGYRR